MSTGEQMDGISHIRTIQCRTHFQSGMVHKVSFKYFSVMLGGMLHTSHDSMEEIPLIWRLNRPVQTINIFVIIVATLTAVHVEKSEAFMEIIINSWLYIKSCP